MKGDIGKWQVRVEWLDFSMTLNVYIVRWCEGEWVDYVTNIKGRDIEIKRVGMGDAIEPCMVFHSDMSRQILQGFADVCDKEGFRPEGKPILENELTATKYHLEDMRKLVFDSGK